ELSRLLSLLPLDARARAGAGWFSEDRFTAHFRPGSKKRAATANHVFFREEARERSSMREHGGPCADTHPAAWLGGERATTNARTRAPVSRGHIGCNRGPQRGTDEDISCSEERSGRRRRSEQPRQPPHTAGDRPRPAGVRVPGRPRLRETKG